MSMDELDHFAELYGLQNDDIVLLKRLELICSTIAPNGSPVSTSTHTTQPSHSKSCPDVNQSIFTPNPWADTSVGNVNVFDATNDFSSASGNIITDGQYPQSYSYPVVTQSALLPADRWIDTSMGNIVNCFDHTNNFSMPTLQSPVTTVSQTCDTFPDLCDNTLSVLISDNRENGATTGTLSESDVYEWLEDESQVKLLLANLTTPTSSVQTDTTNSCLKNNNNLGQSFLDMSFSAGDDMLSDPYLCDVTSAYTNTCHGDMIVSTDSQGLNVNPQPEIMSIATGDVPHPCLSIANSDSLNTDLVERNTTFSQLEAKFHAFPPYFICCKPDGTLYLNKEPDNGDVILTESNLQQLKFEKDMNTPYVQIGGADGYIIHPLPPNFQMIRGRRHAFFNIGEEIFFSIQFTGVWQGRNLKDIQKELHGMFNTLIQHIRADHDDRDLVRVHINHDSLEKGTIKVSMRELQDLTSEAIMTRIEEVMQSHTTLSVNENFEVGVGIIHVPGGGGRTKPLHVSSDFNSAYSKKSMVIIVNNDHLCLARSLVVAMAKYQVGKGNIDRKEYAKLIRKDRVDHQGLAARQLQEKAGKSEHIPCNINDIPAFEKVLDAQVIVMSNCDVRRPIRTGVDKPCKLYIQHVKVDDIENHFNAIVSIVGFVGEAYFCDKCFKGYRTKLTHRCQYTCPNCKSNTCKNEREVAMMCEACHVTFYSQSCYDNHIPDVCSKFWKCLQCTRYMRSKTRTPDDHICSEWKCECCHEFVVGDHQCYLPRIPIKLPVDSFIYFDFECSQNTGKHIPNLVIAQSVCQSCMDSPLTPSARCNKCGSRCAKCVHNKNKPPCLTCGQREVIFEGHNTQQAFGEWLFNAQHKGVTVIAHNNKGYDGYFLTNYLLQAGIYFQIIFEGSKIMHMRICNGLCMTVLDSLNFLPMPLKAFSNAFNLQSTKGSFPHLFNEAKNWSYVGSYPSPEMYDVQSMSCNDRTAFLNWYEKQKDRTFDFRKEIEEYCRADVNLLREGCMKFRQLIMESAGGIDPFKSVTIASVTMQIYRTLFMPCEYQVCVNDGPWEKGFLKKDEFLVQRDNQWVTVPQNNITQQKYVRSLIAQVTPHKDQYSYASIAWMEWLMEKSKREGNPKFIRHALNSAGEVKVMRYKLDGFCQATNTIYEYNGCVHHGCRSCFPDNTVKHPRTKASMQELYQLTMQKVQALKRLGYNYVTMWEHDFKIMKQNDSDLQQFLSTLDLQEPLQVRESFYGGRTNATRLHCKAEDGQVIKYVDFTSLYSCVLKNDIFPVGHPVIIYKDFKPLSHYYGIAKVKILAPGGLYHPVLPYRSGGKLKFPLCRTCADNESFPCHCSVEERAMLGTWCTPELEKALEKGYVILKIYCVYHWPETAQYGDATQGLFSDYVHAFLLLKQQASGYPSWCDSEEKKVQYITNYKLHEGIDLDPSKIAYNAGLRSTSKLCLNSFWGKWGQRSNLKQSHLIHAPYELLNYVTDPTKKVSDFHILNETTAQVEWEYEDDFQPDDCKTNIYLATFVSCYGRLRLYNILDLLGTQCLYYDTDSCLYVTGPNMVDVPLGDHLGELTSEVPEGLHITEFVATGPKSYAYRLSNGDEVCHVRGFSLNFKNSQLINFESIKSIVTEGASSITVTNPRKITRDAKKHIIYNRVENKEFNMVYTKRYILPDLDTLPFGY